MKIRVINCSRQGLWYEDKIGQEFEVEKIEHLVFQYRSFSVSGVCAPIPSYFLGIDCELVWQPAIGELIDVKREFKKNSFKKRESEYVERVFVAMDGDLFVCKRAFLEFYQGWEIARPIKKHIITIDGKKFELSEESFQSFKKQFEE